MERGAKVMVKPTEGFTPIVKILVYEDETHYCVMDEPTFRLVEEQGVEGLPLSALAAMAVTKDRALPYDEATYQKLIALSDLYFHIRREAMEVWR